MEVDCARQTPTGRRHSSGGLIAILGVLVVCTLFFIVDIAFDLASDTSFLGARYHLFAEAVIVVGLVIGIVFLISEIRLVLERQKHVEAQLKVASGAFDEIVQQKFADWGLTPSERDVALFTIKGLTIAEIAELRQTKKGTIKAQCTAVYRKAAVHGRMQLVSLFIDQLMEESLLGSPQERSGT